MRIAVCLAGQPRTWKMCVRNTHNMFGEVDYFIHTWNENGSAYRNIDYEKLDSVELEAELIQAYRPKAIQIESYTEKKLEGFDSHRYSVCSSIKLKQHYEEQCGFKYDWVFYTRLDFCRFYPIRRENLKKLLPEAKAFQKEHNRARLYGTDDHIVYSQDMSCYCLEDFGYFGLSDDMNLFSNLYTDYCELSKIWKQYESIREYCAEDFVAFFFLNRNIEIRSGWNYWDPGAPVRKPLEKLNIDLGTEEGLQKYGKILYKYGWYYTEETLNKHRKLLI